MRFNRPLGFYLVVSTAFCLACLAPTLPAQAQLDGSWSGTTTQNRPISFTVSNGAVTSVSVSGTVTGAGCTETFTTTFSTSRTISNNSFTVTLTPGTSRTSFVLTGNFTSTSAANGTLSFTLSSFTGVPSCAGCGSTTWTATRAGAPAPTAVIPSTTNLTLIPHSAFGGGYITRRYFTNLSTTSSNALTINRISTSGSLVESSQVTLQPGATLLRADSESQRTQTQTPSVEWYAIGSERPISTSVLFDCCASGSEVISAVGVLPSSPGTSFTAPFHFQRQTSTQPILVMGMAVANRTEFSNTITVRIKDESGNQVSSDALTAFGAYGQTAFTVSDLPNLSAFLQGKDSFVGTLVISGTGQFIPLYVGNLGGRLFSLPLTSSSSGSAAQAPESDTVLE